MLLLAIVTFSSHISICRAWYRLLFCARFVTINLSSFILCFILCRRRRMLVTDTAAGGGDDPS